MHEREWTGSVAVLPESMRLLALQMDELANTGAVDGVEMRGADFLRDHAATLAEWADAVEQLYARLDEGEIPTNAQGIALARFLRPAFRDDAHPADRSAHVSRGGAGLPDSYLYVRLSDGYEGGIDSDGRVST